MSALSDGQNTAWWENIRTHTCCCEPVFTKHTSGWTAPSAHTHTAVQGISVSDRWYEERSKFTCV